MCLSRINQTSFSMNIQTLIVASRTNLKEIQKPFFDIRLEVTQFLSKIRNLVGENRLDGDAVKTGLKSLQSLFSNDLSLPYINFISLSSQKSGNLVSSSSHSLTSILYMGNYFVVHFIALSFIPWPLGMEVAVPHNTPENFAE